MRRSLREKTKNTKPRERKETKHTKKNQTNTRKGQAKQKRGEATNTKQNRRQRGGQNQQRKKRGAGGRRQAEASKKGKRGRPGRQQGQEGGNRTSQEDGRVQLYRCPKGVLDHPRANTSVQEREAPNQHPQHGVEGRAPHRAEAFVAMRRSEDRSQSATTHQTKGMATGPLQVQPDTRREGPAEH